MPAAEFEEREYEIAAVIELAQESGTVLSPGQVAEKLLGYDTVAAPTPDNPIWKVLQVPRPAGLRLLPAHWPTHSRPSHGQLPSAIISLILQFKRPTYLHGPRAAQWRYWHRPYYRFERTSHQHRVLTRLERRLGDQAVVRYAAPAFWQRGALEQAHLRRNVLSRSGYVSPLALGTHRVWTYVQAGIDGRANRSGRRLPFATFESLLENFSGTAPRSAQELVPLGNALERHLDVVGAAAREREPDLRRMLAQWMAQLREGPIDLTDTQIRSIANLASIVTLTSKINAEWCVMAFGA